MEKHLEPDLWLTGIIERPVFSYDPSFSGRHEALRSLPKGAFVYAKVPVDDSQLVQSVESYGFHLVDTNIILEKKSPEPWSKCGWSSIAPAKPGDRDKVTELARRCFKFSRFHLDPMIPREVADTIKAAWAGNFFSGERGELMLVARRETEVVGFLQCLVTDKELTVDLL